MKIYASGPIYKDNHLATEGWRNEISQFFAQKGNKVIDPCRGKNGVYEPGFHSPNEILLRDLRDVDEADIILVNMNLIGDKLPIGTVSEIMYGWTKQKPVVIISEDPRIIAHPWLVAMSVKILPTVQESLDYIDSFWGAN